MDLEEQSSLYVTHDGKNVVLSVYDTDDESRISIAVAPHLAYRLAREITNSAIEVEERNKDAGSRG